MPFDDSPDADAAGKRRTQSAEDLREQAAACRRLANQARTRAGKKGLDALGDHFDEQASKLDWSSKRR